MRRSSMTAQERRQRSRAAWLVHFKRLLRGTISVRELTCGKKNCRCARGEYHTPMYLVQSRKGKVQQLYIPKGLEKQVREGIKNYHQAHEYLEKLSEVEWKRLEQRKE